MRDDTAVVSTLRFVVGALVAALFVAAYAPRHEFPWGGHRPPFLTGLLQVKLFFSTFTVVLLGVLVATYVRIYRDLPNRLTLSLITFAVALALYAVTANPLVPVVFGFEHSVGPGPFTFLPDMFASFAVIVLLHQSHR